MNYFAVFWPSARLRSRLLLPASWTRMAVHRICRDSEYIPTLDTMDYLLTFHYLFDDNLHWDGM
jgi:hypothetical protein